MKKIGIAGYGVVGQTWAQNVAWSRIDAQLSIFDPFASDIPPALEVKSPQGLADSDLLLVFVPATAAYSVIYEAIPAKSERQLHVLDFSSNSPESKWETSKVCAMRGVGYSDVTIMGAVAVHKEKAPLVISGDPPSKIAREVLETAGARISYLSDSHAGDAARLKLARSVVTKGLEALAVEARAIARELGVSEAYSDVFQDIDDAGFTNILESMVATHDQHRHRRGVEVKEALALLTGLGRESALLRAVARNYEYGPFQVK